MELNNNLRTSVNQDYYSNKNSNPKYFLVFQQDGAYGLFGLRYKRIFFPQMLQAPSSLFDFSSSLFDVSYTLEENVITLFSNKVNTILNKFSVSKKTLCFALNISRPTLYSWLEKSTVEPDEVNTKKVTDLYNILEELKLQDALYFGYVEEKMPKEEKSIIELIKNEVKLDNCKDELKRLIRQAYKLSENRKREIDASLKGISYLSENKQDLIMEDNINSL